MRSWRATCGGLHVVVRQRAEGRFQIAVGDGKLTHFHPVTGCDLDAVKLQACRLAAQFGLRRLGDAHAGWMAIAGLEWTTVTTEDSEVPVASLKG